MGAAVRGDAAPSQARRDAAVGDLIMDMRTTLPDGRVIQMLARSAAANG